MNKRKRWFRSILSIVLSVAILCGNISVEAFASSDDNLRDVDFTRPEAVTTENEAAYDKEGTLREPKKYYTQPEPEGTLVAVDEYAKTYQTEQGTFITQLGGEANTYEDEDGNLKLVDNTLTEKRPWFSADYYENKANDYTVKLPMKITKKNGVEVTKDGYTIEMIPQVGDFTKPVAVENAVLYNDVQDGIDYQYTVLGDTIKEDIVLNKAVNKNAFSFQLNSGKLKLAEKDGSIIVYDKDEKQPIFTIVAPEMSDASGEISTEIKLSLSGNVVTMTADKNWLQAPERAYPVRIDPAINISNDSINLYGVQQGSADKVIGDNNYPYCGYDDGVTSSNLSLYGNMHMMTRTYVSIGYNFSQISKEAKIDSATFSVYHYTKWSKGKTNFGLYTVDKAWNPATLTWNAQTGFPHTFIQYQPSNNGAGWLHWNVRDVVNSWIQGTATNNGFVIKAQDERNMQCEVFHNKRGANKPILTINWSVPDPVDPAYPLENLNVALRPITEKDVNGKLLFDAVFADGVATPEATVKYWLVPDNTTGYAQASLSYKYPDSTAFAATFPNGTKYKDKLSNWQTQLFGGLSYDKAYKISATATKSGQTGKQADSDKFLIYKIKQTDTFPYIANYYGVPLNTIMRDNRVQDTLVVENNTIFIRNPKTEIAYSPEPLTDDAKKAIDSALMGRGLHCEYGFEPINLNTGNFYFNAVDATIADFGGDFAIERTYNSKGDATHSLFGRKWSFAYSEALSKRADGQIAYSVGDGKTLYFTPDGDGGYTSPYGYHYTLKTIPYAVGEDTYYRYELYDIDGSYKKFNAWGLLSEVVDANGFVTTIAYDENYNIKSITSPSGKVYGITCKDGRIAEILLPNGSVLRYAYDESGNLTTFTDANGNNIRYVYDKQHRMTEWYDQEGNRVVKNEYDDRGRVTEQVDANGKKVTLSYKENQTVTTDANGNKTTYTYDDRYRTIKIAYPNGKVEECTYTDDNCLASDGDYTYTYDNRGNKLTETRKDGAVQSYTYNERNQTTSITGFDGVKTTFAYSPAGDLVQICYADGTTESYTYDNLHRVLTHTNAKGNTESYVYDGAVATGYKDYKGNTYEYHYDAMNQLITVIAPDGSVSRKMYDAAGVQIGEQSADGGYTEYTLNKVGNVVRVTDPKGYASDFVYDGMYNILKGTDPQGNTVSYTYDGNGNQTSMTDALGNKTTYTYDSRNRLLTEKDSDGNVLTYTYDIDGNLLSKTDAEGNTTKTKYDKVLQLPIETTDALGGKTKYEYTVTGALKKVTYADDTSLEYEYDLRGRMTKFVDETGLISTFVYDANGNVITLTENDVRTYTYEYDANNNLIKTKDPLGNVVTYTYDSLNRQVEMISELGNKTGYQYDAAGRLTKTIDAAGGVQATTYDKNGNIQSVTDANGNQTQYTYDAVNNPISEKDAKGNIINYTYDSLQQLASITDATGSVTKYEYDHNGNITKVTDGLGYVYTMEYDKNGNAKKITLPNGDVSTFTYDKLGRTIKTVDAAGLTKNYSYDSMGRVTKVTDNTGAKLTYKYDKYGRLISQTDVSGRSESYEYDSFSQVVAVTGTDGNQTTFAYDALGRVLSSTDAEDKTTTFVYDSEGNLLEQTEADGAAYRYVYDCLNRVVEATDPVGATTRFVYDKNSNLLSATDGNGVKNSYTYDKLNQLLTAVDGNGNTTAYEYDELSRVIALIEPEGGRTEYRYDAMGNTTKVKDANGYITEFVYDSVGNAVKVISQRGAEISYTYDKHNVLTKTVDPLGNTTTYEVDLNGLTTKMIQPNGGEYTYAYDEVNRITGITTPNGYEKTFTYDKFGNLVKEKDNMDCTTTYEYDKMHRITKVTDPSGKGTLYAYDESGNLASVLEANGGKTSYVYDLLDRITESADPEGKVTKLQYDLAGNVTSVTEQGGRTTKLGYDNNYNLTTITDPMGYVNSQTYDKNNRVVSQTNPLGETVGYEYDALGQATKVTDASGAATRYAYDAHGNLTKVINASGGETKYTYDLSDRLIKVTDPLQRVTTYDYDSMGNLTEQVDANGKKTTYTYDKEGNLTSLTDASGATEQMTYDVVGNLKSIVRPDGSEVKYDYDKLNQLVSKSYSQDDTEVLYLYDNMGNRTSMTDTDGESTYTYDIMNRITSVTAADQRKVSYAYDECGRLASITYADGRVVSYEYDLNDRLTKVTDGDKVTKYTYDATGRVVKTERPDESVTTYTYDVRGNLTKLENLDADGKILSSFVYTYNEQGYITKEVAQNETDKVTRTYTYNEAGELTAFREIEGLKEACYKYTYDDAGNRIRLEKSGIDRPETITYKYNAANQLVSENSTIDGKTEYAYDKNGSLISEETEGEKEVTYEYTVENRLKAVRSGGELLMAATYDGDGNRTFQISRKEAEQYVEKGDTSDGEENPDTPIAEDGETVGSVSDNHGDTTTAKNDSAALTNTEDATRASVNTYYEKVYADPADTIFWYGFGQGMLQFFGNVNTALSAYLSDWFCHAWDYVTGQYKLELHSTTNDMYSGEDVDAMRRAGLSEEEIAEITGGSLDARGNVVVQSVDSTKATEKKSDSANEQSDEQPEQEETIVIPANPDEETRIDYELTYYVNNVNTEHTQVLMEYGKREELKNIYTYGNERISAETLADTYNPITDDYETDYYLYDGRGSVTQVVSADAIVAEYSYDPFGNVTSGAPQFDSFYGYNAEDTNPVTGLQYLRARYYDSESGRFSVADTYLGDISDPLTLNRYSYTTNNPVMFVDPSGHFVLTALLVGAAVGAVVGAVSSGVKSYKEQSKTGKVNGWTVAKDALVGGVIGGVVGAAAGVVGAAVGAGVAAVAGTGFAATVAAGALGGVAAGIVSRGGNTLLNSAASNFIQKNNLYDSAVYTQQKSPEQVWKEAVGNAFEVEAMLTDAAMGAVFSMGTYGIQKLVGKLKTVRQHSCGDAPEITSQNPVEDITPDVPKETVQNSVDDVKPKNSTGNKNLTTNRVNYYLDEALNNVDSDTTILGSTGQYDIIGENEGYTYFKMGDDVWNALEEETMSNYDEIWKVNQSFLDEQIIADKNILLSNDPNQGYYFDDGTERFYQREIDYLKENGYSFIRTETGLWKAIRK